MRPGTNLEDINYYYCCYHHYFCCYCFCFLYDKLGLFLMLLKVRPGHQRESSEIPVAIFLHARCPSSHPNNSVKAPKEKKI